MEVIDTYIAKFSPEIQEKLNEIRQILREELPEADEVINYGIPTYKIKGQNVVHFGGFKKHVGFYPAPSGILKFQQELSGYKGAKGSVQFPHNEPLPTELIRRITQFRLEEIQKK